MKKLNVNEVLWFIILLGFCVYIFYLLSQNRIMLYVHPRMVKYSILLGAVLVIFTILQLRRILKKHAPEKFRKGYLLFFIPLILAYSVNPNQMPMDMIKKKGISISRSIDTKLDSSGSISAAIKKEELYKAKAISFNKDNFDPFIYDMNENLDKYLGKRIIICGFVSRNNDFSQDQFTVTRLLMICCAADTQGIGLMAQWDKAQTLKEELWVEAIGIIDKAVYHDQWDKNQKITVPLIKIDSIKPIDMLEDPYVYPNFKIWE
ncbi:MAG: TIGR03943 family protein [Candidatus Omnitrophica bacterium]|nr:TIGR03943 family protein [Candidatus Omnitrophota bacterium]